MNILSSIYEFLNTKKEILYKDSKEIVRKSLGLINGETLYFNGYRYKPIIYIDENLSLKNTEIPIRRLLLILGNNQRKTIYLYPSFVIKYCPFPLRDIERVYVEFILKDIEPFDKLNDPDGLLESSLPYKVWVTRLKKILTVNKFQHNFSKLFYETFYTLVSIEKDNDFFSQCLSMIRQFVNALNLRKLDLLSFANFQLPFR